jgi:surfactin synthase thioesterase subunit
MRDPRGQSGVALDRFSQMPEPAVSLICLPFAGAGASFFKEWSRAAGSLKIAAVQLPGREKRFLEEPYREVVQAVTGILPDVLRMVDSGRAIVFGHSLGAVLAYELAHRLAHAPGVQLEHLIVSGSPGPWTPRKKRATGLGNEGFLDQVRQFAGHDHPALSDPELRDMLLPTLRADVEMHENYDPPKDRLLEIPITSLRGSNDELVTSEEAAQWQSATCLPLRLVEIPGGHMYLVEAWEALLRTIESLCSSAAVT